MLPQLYACYHVALVLRYGWVCVDVKALAKLVQDVSALDRLKAMNALLGVGKLKTGDVPSAALEAAHASIKLGVAFEATPYADAVPVYL